MIRITHHGGECCGIKHICHLGHSPDYIVYGRKERASILHYDRHGDPVYSSQNVYHKAMPKEKTGERFDRYLDMLRHVRPFGIVEVTLVVNFGGGFHANTDYQEDIFQRSDGQMPEKVDLDEFVEEPEDEDCFQDSWVPFIEERGFRLINSCPNTNSGNIVKVYHLNMDEKWHEKVNNGEIKFVYDGKDNN